MLASDAFLDFIHVGVPRAGSAWLRAALEEHPEVRLADRSPGEHGRVDLDSELVALDDPAGLERYRGRFAGAEPYRMLGDIVPGAARDPLAAVRLARRFPHLKILAFLRDPLDLLTSLHGAAFAEGRVREPFEQALRQHPEWLERVLYHRQLQPFFDHFAPEQVCVVLYDRFFADERRHLPHLWRFLEVDDAFKPSILGYAVTAPGVRESPAPRLRDLFARRAPRTTGDGACDWTRRYKGDFPSPVARATRQTAHEVTEATRQRIAEAIAYDLARLESDLGLDLAHWRTTPPPAGFDHGPTVPVSTGNVIHLATAAASLHRRRSAARA
ncbi:MAG: hypothetical protein KDE35_11840 [Geminicoccaceae bacterium]|nr:hypothetical protein [Geminicoccaceae bacterium]